LESSWGNEYASINYIGLIPYLIKSIQESHITITNLNDELNNTKEEINNLKIQNEELETIKLKNIDLEERLNKLEILLLQN
jgi:hypothetical protein